MCNSDIENAVTHKISGCDSVLTDETFFLREIHGRLTEVYEDLVL
jgi:hypothetical protein